MSSSFLTISKMSQNHCSNFRIIGVLCGKLP